MSSDGRSTVLQSSRCSESRCEIGLSSCDVVVLFGLAERLTRIPLAGARNGCDIGFAAFHPSLPSNVALFGSPPMQRYAQVASLREHPAAHMSNSDARSFSRSDAA